MNLAGLIGGAMAGAGAAGVAYHAKSSLQEEMAAIQKARDERLAELQEQAAVRSDDRREQATVRAEDRKRAPFREAEAEFGTKSKELIDDPSGTVRERTDPEKRSLRAETYRSKGLVGEAMQMERDEMQRERDTKTDLARTRDDNRADSQLEEQRRHNKASEGIQAANARRAQQLLDEQIKGMGLDRTMKELQLEQAKEQKKYRDLASNEADPAKREQYREMYQLLTGKDNDNFVVTVDKKKDEFGVETAQGIIKTDKRTGKVTYEAIEKLKGGGASGAQPSQAHIDALKKFSSNQAARKAFDQQYGEGAAARILGK
jgi:hypothetical protein